ncbi:MAG: phosphoribosylaminoimidazolesuccinocarboxamide synthase [Nitrospirae bacterium]|nr:phosphoribosylaminoimidazolesuccinocarboxamide synthase [Nitrospirota bacterium]
MDKQTRWEGPLVWETHLEAIGPRKQGKVRDIYDLGDLLLLVATDRLSAFDLVLPDGIPGKGFVLTQLSKFWFDWLGSMKDAVVHHLISMDLEKFPNPCRRYKEILSGRSMLVRKTKPLPVECIVRGYLSGSGWKEYRQTGTICELSLPAGLTESEKLPEPIFTPSTKAVEGHDINISFKQMVETLGEAVAEEVRSMSLKIYKRASDFAAARGIIIADTKLEFGLDPKTGRLVLIDEVLTPDSSRFWPKDGYVSGGPQPSFDKQYVRDYLDLIRWNHRPPAPHLPKEVIQKTSEKYFEAMSRLTDRIS